MLEAGGEGSQSAILGYGKGKALEKRVCMNCLRKGIKCEWDKGGQGKPESFFFFFDFNSKVMIGKSCQPCQNSKI